MADLENTLFDGHFVCASPFGCYSECIRTLVETNFQTNTVGNKFSQITGIGSDFSYKTGCFFTFDKCTQYIDIITEIHLSTITQLFITFIFQLCTAPQEKQSLCSPFCSRFAVLLRSRLCSLFAVPLPTAYLLQICPSGLKCSRFAVPCSRFAACLNYANELGSSCATGTAFLKTAVGLCSRFAVGLCSRFAACLCSSFSVPLCSWFAACSAFVLYALKAYFLHYLMVM